MKGKLHALPEPAPSPALWSTVPESGIDHVPPPTLGQVVDSLSPHALHLVRAAGRLDAEAGEPMIHGVGEPLPVTESGLLLLTGNRPAHSETPDVVRRAAGAGYCGVVVKAFGDDMTGIAEAAEDAGIALLTTPDEMAWRHLDALLTATRSATVSGAAGHYASVGLGDLFALANAISAAVGGATTIEDHTGQVIAYSNLPQHEIDDTRRLSILGRQTPYRPVNKQRYRQLLHMDGPVFFPALEPDIASRLAVTVRAGNEVLCLIWVLADRPPLVPGAEAILVDAARATALHLLRVRGQRDPKRWHLVEALRSLLDGSMTPQAASRQLGLTVDTPTTVVGIAPIQPEPQSVVAAARIVDLVTLFCESWHQGALCVADSGVVYALLPAERGVDQSARLMRFGSDLSAAVERATKLDVAVAVGSPAPGLADVPQSRRMADCVLDVLTRQSTAPPSRRIASVEDVHSSVVLQTIAERGATEPDLMLKSVRAMLDHDDRHGTAYSETLLAYLSSGCDVIRAAGAMRIHENTFRYRVRRVQELFDVDLTEGDDLLVSWLQLRLLRSRPDGRAVPRHHEASQLRS